MLTESIGEEGSGGSTAGAFFICLAIYLRYHYPKTIKNLQRHIDDAGKVG
jgi:hypothetical protein